MKFLYSHILDLLEHKPEIMELSSIFFQLGHEHEINNEIFDFEFTPNRGDCLSLVGLARDLNVFFKSNINLPLYQEEIPSYSLDFINTEKEKCSSISFLKLEVKSTPEVYKDYLENYFKDLEIKKNNFFTDVSNYVNYEMGQPTHCYDYESIEGTIYLESNKASSKFTTLLGKNLVLDNEDLVFRDDTGIINIAGIMGGLRAACKKSTTKVLIECAYFQPESIIGKAIKYDIHSDASHKFERGVDPHSHDKVLRRVINIIQDHCEVTELKLHSENYNIVKDNDLNFDVQVVNNILGSDVSEIFYRESLNKLGFKISPTNKIQIPTFRHDITQQNDLAEELARVIGYDNLPLQSLKFDRAQIIPEPNLKRKLKSFFVDNGFTESINMPFIAEDLVNSKTIRVDNPLDSNREYLRTNITNSLIENVIYNEKRQKDSIKLFEMSDIYYLNKGEIVKESKIAIIVSGRLGLNYSDFSKKLDKFYLTDLFKLFDYDIKDEIIEVDRALLDSKIKTPIYALEIPTSLLLSNIIDIETSDGFANTSKQYKHVSEFPSSYRDFSFSISDEAMLEPFMSCINESSSKYLKDFYMFDFFNNKKNNHIKVGFRFIFQSDFGTLKESDVNLEVDNLLKPILLIDSVDIPGRNKNS